MFNDYYFRNKSSIIDVRLGYVQTSENNEILKVKLGWSRSSQLLQRVAFLACFTLSLLLSIDIFNFIVCCCWWFCCCLFAFNLFHCSCSGSSMYFTFLLLLLLLLVYQNFAVYVATVYQNHIIHLLSLLCIYSCSYFVCTVFPIQVIVVAIFMIQHQFFQFGC